MTISLPDVKPIISSLSPELSTLLKKQADSLLNYLIHTNFETIYFREAPLLSELRTAIQRINLTREDARKRGNISPQLSVHEAFVTSVPLSSYEDYRPFVDRFLKSPRLLSDVSNILAPGIPAYVVSSSGTSAGAGPAKFFLKYKHPLSTSPYGLSAMKYMIPKDLEGGTFCAIYNLRHSDVLDVVQKNSTGNEVVSRVPISFASSAMVRMSRGWNIDQDPSLIRTKVPNTTSPLAICFIHSYQSALLMHGLFALADNSLQMISTIFSTTFVDLMRLLEENWDAMVQAIDNGVVPKLDGVEDVYDYIQSHLVPNPHRAAQLRAIGNDTTSPGWAKRLWPDLTRILAIGSGTFSRVVPQACHYIGKAVSLQSPGLASSEGWIATSYDPTRDLNLYSTSADDLLEYLDVSAPDDAANLKQTWEVEVGKTYEIVLTTRDGFWRYRLGDVVEVAGFNPVDGQPLIRYMSRRNVIMRASGEFVAEKELMDAVQSLGDIIGDIAEYTVVVDDRQPSRAYGFLIELKGQIGAKSISAMSRLDDFLQSTNTTYAHFRSSGHLGVPTIRLLSLGTYSDYREWKARGNVIGSGQIKVPTVTTDGEAIEWLMARVIGEISP